MFKFGIGVIFGAILGRKVLTAAWSVLEDTILGRSK